MLYYSLYYVALFAFLVTITNMWVIVQRMRHNVPFGDGDIDEVIKARSAHHNLLEFGVIFILMLMSAEFLGMTRLKIIVIATIFFIFRLFHMYYMLARWKLPTFIRILASAGSHVINLKLMYFIITSVFLF